MTGRSTSSPEPKKSVSGNIWVPPGKMRSGKEKDILYTRGVGACIELGIYDKAAKVGHMAHIFSTRGSQTEIIGKLAAALDLSGADPSVLQGWLSGGSSEANPPPRLKPEILLRSQIIQSLASLGLDPQLNLQVEWNNDVTMISGASLNCDTGIHTVVKLPLP